VACLSGPSICTLSSSQCAGWEDWLTNYGPGHIFSGYLQVGSLCFKVGKDIYGEKGIPSKLISVPRQISSDCGIYIRLNQNDFQKVEEALADRVDIEEIYPL
jgi:hypothetical protein